LLGKAACHRGPATHRTHPAAQEVPWGPPGAAGHPPYGVHPGEPLSGGATTSYDRSLARRGACKPVQGATVTKSLKDMVQFDRSRVSGAGPHGLLPSVVPFLSQVLRPNGRGRPPELGSWPHSDFPQYSFAWENGQIDSRPYKKKTDPAFSHYPATLERPRKKPPSPTGLPWSDRAENAYPRAARHLPWSD